MKFRRSCRDCRRTVLMRLSWCFLCASWLRTTSRVDFRAWRTGPAAERFARGHGSGSYQRNQILFVQHGFDRARLWVDRQAQFRKENLRAQGGAFLNPNVILLKQPHVRGYGVVSRLFAGNHCLEAERTHKTGLIKTNVAELHRFARLLGRPGCVVIIEQMHIGGLRPVAALQLEAHGLAHRQERKVVFPYGGARKVNRLAVLSLDESRPAGGTQVLDSSDHSSCGALFGTRVSNGRDLEQRTDRPFG